MSNEWPTVTSIAPCRVCGKPDWCSASPDGAVARCNRVQSERPARGIGWLHFLDAVSVPPPRSVPPQPAPQKPTLNAALWWEAGRYLLARRIDSITEWAGVLGLSAKSLVWLGATTCCGMLCFPMHDGAGNVCGIRTRTSDGQKRAILGSRAGVFLATVQLPDLDVLICEGPTDAAAALELGYEPIGRPSCMGQESVVLDTLRRWGKNRVTICADNDGPGIVGGEKLATVLRAGRVAVRLVVTCGHKDLRNWLRAGATRPAVESAWSQGKYECGCWRAGK